MKYLLVSVLMLCMSGVVFSEDIYLQPENAAYIQDVYFSHQMPQDIHDAFAGVARLLAEQSKLKQHGQALSTEQQTQLSQYKEKVQGLKIILIGYPACQPCSALFDLLDQGKDGTCLLEDWIDNGIDFYMLNTIVEKKLRYEDTNLLYWWDIYNLPVLMLVKDGVPVVRLNGYNAARSAEILQVLEEQVNKWC